MTPPTLAAYRLATSLATPAVAAWLSQRARRGKEDPERLAERWGMPSAPRPDGPLLWVHGASVGESVALLSLVERARVTRPEVSILATSGTRAAAKVLAGRLPAGAIHQYAPIDTPAATRAFIDHWRPGLGVFVESEIWPNLLLAAKAGGAGLALLSARLSEPSARRWRRARRSARAVFGAFDLILARDEDQAVTISSLGARTNGLIDLKFGAAALPIDDGLVATLSARWPVILAASTHPGEDALILAAFDVAFGKGSGALLIIAPRHPERGKAIGQLARDAGFSAARRQAFAASDAVDVLVADTVGELGTWYAAADLALIGGSWTSGVGGHNPLEPARLGCPAVAGANVESWPVYGELEARDATRLVAAADLASVMKLARDDAPGLARIAASAAAFVAERDRSVVAGLDRTLALLP